MIGALVNFVIIILVLALVYWVITRIIAASGIPVPPVVLVVVQIVFVVLVVVALIMLLQGFVGGANGSSFTFPRFR